VFSDSSGDLPAFVSLLALEEPPALPASSAFLLFALTILTNRLYQHVRPAYDVQQVATCDARDEARKIEAERILTDLSSTGRYACTGKCSSVTLFLILILILIL
jgi:hypothetical protein